MLAGVFNDFFEILKAKTKNKMGNSIAVRDLAKDMKVTRNSVMYQIERLGLTVSKKSVVPHIDVSKVKLILTSRELKNVSGMKYEFMRCLSIVDMDILIWAGEEINRQKNKMNTEKELEEL